MLLLLKDEPRENKKEFFDIKSIKGLKKERNEEPVISVKNLTVAFRNTNSRKQIVEIIRNISFDVYRGEILGFIGESGSGKSVTAKSLFGMNVNSFSKAKSLKIDNIEMVKEGTDQLIRRNSEWRKIRGKKISYIPQNPMTSLNPTMKIGKQIMEVLDTKEEYRKKTEREKKTIIIDLLEKFGISNAKERITLYPHEFSGGMRQRVVIAMSVISKPDVIIADEPTTALDPTIQASVLSLFKVISKEYNIAIILVSHDISVISTLCDHVNVFYAGRIIETAPKYELFTDSRHPYTWALLSSMPESNDGSTELYTLDGTPPNFASLPPGDPFSVRNKYALEIDFKEEPPLIKVGNNSNHYAATWLLHPEAKKVKRPQQVEVIARQVREDFKNGKQ
ncbi:peptide ABC transporter ATP-binding protein [Mycoplasma marinum]|uniref:Peptide ABC transporter ATP-binding protein n=2 Tax=Mycoplasma marinum TaxID=1937190 RepID=A0A4R0XLT0_9MOLU|nr:peptide ABC transporter ATP-binding protein [Mycoplasma marinum]